MYKLFTQVHEENNSVIKPPSIDYVLRSYERDTLEVEEYRKKTMSVVKSNHYLCRLITAGSLPPDYSLERFMAASYTRSPYIAKHFGMVSPINYGSVHENVFLGPSGKELFIHDESYFNPFDPELDWKNICAINILYIEDSSMSYQLLDGGKHSTAKDIGVFSINISLLLYQFRCFQKDQIGRNILNPEQGKLDISHFVKMYVLPNMLKKKMGFMILNRFMNLFYGKPMDEQVTSLSLSTISDYREKLDREMLKIISYVKDSRKMYYSILKNIPCVFQKDAQVLLQMPDMNLTRQVWWVMFFSRLKIMKFLIDIGGEKAIGSNSFYISVLQVDLKRLKSENLIDKILDQDTTYDYKLMIDDFFSLR